MSKLTALKAATTRSDLAALLSSTASGLAYIVHKLDEAAKYKEFDIPKRYGGTRNIAAPTDELKLLQSKLSNYLQDCLAELEAAGRKRASLSHGFKREHSIITNAQYHRRRRFVFNIDLKDFFPSIHFGRVRGFFLKDKEFALAPDIAQLIAQIACYKGALPQGSPCSPVISNLVGNVLDTRLLRLASANGCRYTRYADDLTFSTNEEDFPKSIATIETGSWVAGKSLSKVIESSGFDINQTKTRMQYTDSRQDVTGLVVNRKVNVRNDYRRLARAMTHRLLTTGQFEFNRRTVDASGALIQIKVPGTPPQLHGMLSFVDQIDLFNKKLMERAVGPLLDPNLKNRTRLLSKEHIYRRFLLFKEFYTAERPVLLCEGRTDNVYVRHAIRNLVASMPTLASKDPTGSISLKVRIFKYTETSTGRILGINGGTGELANFIRKYAADGAKFKAPGGYQPVLLLVDNDLGSKGTGAGKIFNAIKEVNKAAVLSAPYIHVWRNLYVVPTPLAHGGTNSMVEDLFDAPTKAITVGGKKFNPGKTIDPATEFGKQVFAEKVVKANAATINFSGFTPWLQTISDVISLHFASHSKPAKVP